MGESVAESQDDQGYLGVPQEVLLALGKIVVSAARLELKADDVALALGEDTSKQLIT